MEIITVNNFIKQNIEDENLREKISSQLYKYSSSKNIEELSMRDLCLIRPSQLCRIVTDKYDVYDDTVNLIGLYKIQMLTCGEPDIGFSIKQYKEARETFMRYDANRKHISKIKRKETVTEDFMDIVGYYMNNPNYERLTKETTTAFVEKSRDKKFGKLTAKIPFKRNDVGDVSIYWLCQCDCENWIMLQKADLKHIHSCGCDTYQENFVGRKIDTLTCVEQKKVLSKSGNKVIKLKIQCDCGNTKIMTPSRFLKGKNCGRWCKYSLTNNQNGKHLKNLFYGNTNVAKLGRTESNCNSKTGYLGVWYNIKIDKYLSYITFKGKRENLGYYNLAKEAYRVRLMAQKILQDEFIEELEKDEFVINNKYLMQLIDKVKQKKFEKESEIDK